MYESKKMGLLRLKRSIGEILPYRIYKKEILGKWLLINADTGIETAINIPYKWNPETFPAIFKTDLYFPETDKKTSLNLDLWFGGETAVTVDGESYGEINPFHRLLDVSSLTPDRSYTFVFKTVPKSLFGKHNANPCFDRNYLVYVDKEIDYIIKYFDLIIKTIEISGNDDFNKKMFSVLSDCLSKVRVPRDSSTYFSVISEDESVIGEISSIWRSENYPFYMGKELPENYRWILINAFEELRNEVKTIKKLYPNNGKVSLVGHSHVDYAWLWPEEETLRKIQRTFSNAVRLSDKFPQFIFNQSSAQMYEDVKRLYPELYSKIKRLVAEKKWEPSGNMWVECDTNISSPESLIRQFLYGTGFFEREFGEVSNVAWLPDVFGFSWILPQIIKKSGLNALFTIKLTWNEKNKFPYDLCVWRGVDGSEIVFHSFDNPDGGYNGNITPKAILKTWENYKDKDKYPETLLSFGYGDGGGGPTDEMLENFEILKDFPYLPKIEIKSAKKLFNEYIKIKNRLNTYDNELYLELHRGTSSSQGRTKILHKMAEDNVFITEFLASVIFKDDDYPTEEIELLWKKILKNEFHDILPGSSIREVYEHTEDELKEVISSLQAIRNEAINRVKKEENGFFTLINHGSFEKRINFISDKTNGAILKGPDGKKLNPVKTSGEKYLYSSEEIIKPFEKIVYSSSFERAERKIKDYNKAVMENKYLKATVQLDGSIKIYDKDNERNVFTDRGNILMFFKDVPSYWDAWDIAVEYEKCGEKIKADTVRKVENSEKREMIEVLYSYQGTRIVQKYVLWNNTPRIDILTEIHCHSRRSMIKAMFPFNLLTRRAKYDLGAGYIERSTTRNDDYERARFEVPGQRWADISEPNYGIAVLNNGKYGHSCDGSTYSLTLLRSPIFPDFFADEGYQKFTYSIYLRGNKELYTNYKEVEEIEDKLVLYEGKIVYEIPFEIKNKNFKVLSYKKGEKTGNILRISEISGFSGILSINGRFSKCFLTDNLEEKTKEIFVEKGVIKYGYKPFEIITFLIE